MSLTFALSFMCHTPLIISLENVGVCYNHIRVRYTRNEVSLVSSRCRNVDRMDVKLGHSLYRMNRSGDV
jgi:hypothetical protein